MIRLGRPWCHTEPDRKGYYWVGFTDPGYEGEGWPLWWLRKKRRREGTPPRGGERSGDER